MANTVCSQPAFLHRSLGTTVGKRRARQGVGKVGAIFNLWFLALHKMKIAIKLFADTSYLPFMVFINLCLLYSAVCLRLMTLTRNKFELWIAFLPTYSTNYSNFIITTVHYRPYFMHLLHDSHLVADAGRFADKDVQAYRHDRYQTYPTIIYNWTANITSRLPRGHQMSKGRVS